MLILAGVSLNAIVGDNGILTNAQNATILQSCAALEEFLNEEYVSLVASDKVNSNIYDELEAIDILQTYGPTSKYFYIPKYEHIGNLMYILDSEGNAIYLIKKSGLPEDIQKSLNGGDAGEGRYNDYFTMNDVYGVTKDLKVYYCSNGKESIKGINLADLNKADFNETILSDNNSIYNLIASKDKNNDGKISIAEVKAIDEISIDSSSGLSDLSELNKLPNLKRLSIKDVNYSSLAGLEYSPYIEHLTINNSKIGDYNSIKYLYNLKELDFSGETQDEFDRLMDSMKESTYSKLKSVNIHNNEITNISKMSEQKDGTKTAVTDLKLNSNQIMEIKALLGYTKVEYLNVGYNKNLVSLSGIDNMTKLRELTALRCNLGANEKDIKDEKVDALTCFKNLKSLYNVNLTYNTNLKWIDYITVKNSYGHLMLEGCTNLDVSSVASIADVYNNTTWKNIDNKYNRYLSSSDFIKYGNLNLNNASDEIKALEGMSEPNKEKVRVIDLSRK